MNNREDYNAHINIISNGGSLTKGYYSHINVEKFEGCPPKIRENGDVSFECGEKEHGFIWISPDFNKMGQNNPNVFSSIFNYGNQITAMQYYKKDQELIENEKMFKVYNGSYVPMAYCLSYVQKYAVPDDLKGTNFFTAIPTLF